MDWFSFTIGFLAFPAFALSAVGVYAFVRRLQGGTSAFSDLTSRGSTLSFSPQLIGEIGETLESEASEPAAKAS